MTPSESILEEAALEWFGELGYAVGRGPQMAPGEVAAELDGFGVVVRVGRLREAILGLNPAISESRSLATLRDPAPAILAKLMPGEFEGRTVVYGSPCPGGMSRAERSHWDA